MPYVVVNNFGEGLDTRRHAMTAPPGTLRRCVNAAISRGGEIVKRRAFVPTYSLPPDATVGLATVQGQIYVFGSDAAPALPLGVSYQRLEHPGGVALQRVLSWDVFGKKLYVVAQFVDGSTFHFYDGVRVTDWYDGRARTHFTVAGGVAGDIITSVLIGGVEVLGVAVPWAVNDVATAQAVVDQINSFVSSPDYEASRFNNTVNIAAQDSGAEQNGLQVQIVTTGTVVITPNPTVMAGGSELQAATSAHTAMTIGGGGQISATLTLTGGTVGSTITSVKIGAVEIQNLVVNWATSDDVTATALANQINAYASAPNYSAVAVGNKVIIVPTDGSTTANGLAVAVTKTGTLVVATSGTITFGKISSIKIDGVEILGATVAWATTNDAMATAIAAQISTFVSSPNYEATASGSVVTITATETGTAANGLNATATIIGYLTVAPNPATLTGGATATFVPGSYVKTAQTKMYATSGSVMHFSGIDAPTKWTTDSVGAGFINMENQDGQSEQLVSLERYFSMMAVFGRRSVQMWQIDVDPAKNQQSQVLRNTGTIAAQSVEQVGDNDVFYLSDSGIRSLRARDSSNAAVSNDIGSPIDDLVVDWVSALGAAQVSEATAIIEPIMGRYWLAIGSTIFTLSRYPGNKITAWSTYSPGFTPEAFVVVGDSLYARSGDMIYLYGGPGGFANDNSLVEIELPLIDAEKPAHHKKWSAVDCVVQGHWRIYAGFDPLNPQARELIAQIDAPTLSMQRIALEGYGTHASIKFENDTDEEAKLCNFIIHFELADAG